MRRLIELADSALADGMQCVLCTVVRLDGSGYGRPGSRLLVTEAGDRSGAISGGCLEKELCRRVWGATQTQPKLIAFDTRGNSIDAAHTTGCEGVVYVVCQRISSQQTRPLTILKSAMEAIRDTLLVTVYRTESPDYHLGDAWAFRDGQPLPFAQEPAWPATEFNFATIEDFASKDLFNGTCSLTFYDSAGRAVEAAVETLQAPRRLWVFGAGEDAIPLSHAATELDWQVTVVGHHPELTRPDRFPNAHTRCGQLHEIAAEIPESNTCDAIVMTHDFERDALLLPILLSNSSVRSIGLLGPKRRLGKLLMRLHQRGFVLTDAQIERLRSPVGLDIGARTPSEIAISIIAELIALPGGRRGGSLHERGTSIHDRNAHHVLPKPAPLLEEFA